MTKNIFIVAIAVLLIHDVPQHGMSHHDGIHDSI